jgi:predicted nucleic acid binding AN1-type Zn finger protein
MNCNFVECKKKCVLLIGDCKFCEKHYCPMHRLPEKHMCANLEKCKLCSFEKNKKKIIEEKLEDIRIR